MSEHIEPAAPEAASPETARFGRLWQAAKYAGMVTLPTLWGAAMGAAVRVQFPRNVELSEDIMVAVSADLGGEGIRAGEGFAGVQDMTLTQEVGPLDVGGLVTVRRFDVDVNDPESVAEFASLIAEPGPNILEPMRDALETSIERGAVVGGLSMLAVGGAALLVRHKLQQKDNKIAQKDAVIAKQQEEIQTLRQQQDKAEDTPKEETPPATAGKPNKLQSLYSKFGRPAAYAAAAAVAVGAPVAAQEVNNLPAPAVKTAQPFNADLRERASLPETIEVVGTGAMIINKAAELAFKQIELGDRSSRIAGESFDKVLEEFVANNGLDYLADPDIQPVLMLSDIHCNAPFIEHILPRLVRSFGARHILIAGDTLSTYGKLPLDNGCYDSLLDKLQSVAAELDVEILVLESPGNHDTKSAMDIERTDKDGRKRVRFVRLTEENGYRSDIFGFPVVGSVNPTYSDFEGTRPEGSEAQDKVMAEQGERTADAACKAMEKDEYGLPPLVMTHDIKESVEAMLRGCMFFALSGHDHQDRGIRLYTTPEGRIIMQYTMGTSSGANGGITNITPIKAPATATILKLKHETRSVDGFVKVILYGDKDKPAEIFEKAPPSEAKPLLENEFISDFTDTHIHKTRKASLQSKIAHLNRDYPYKGNLRRTWRKQNRTNTTNQVLAQHGGRKQNRR